MDYSNTVINDDKRQYFYFYIDEYNVLNCHNQYLNHHRIYTGNDARRKLDLVDYNNYHKIIIYPDMIKLINDENYVTIEGINQFYKQNYHFDMQRTHHKLNKHIRFRIVKKNNFEPRMRLVIIHTNAFRRKIAFKSGYFALLGVLSLGCFFYGDKKINSKEFITDEIIYDETLLDEGGKDYSINYNYEPQTFEIKPINYEDFDGYTDETSWAYDNYYDIVKEESERWGVDSNIIMAMLIQESHGKGNNIMQISYSDWNGSKIKMYDFVDNNYKDILFTNNTSKANDKTICITSEDFATPRGNIILAIAIYRHSTERMNHHILAGIQNYNFGDGNMDNVINHATSDLKVSKDELLELQEDLSFVDYVHFASGGDKKYIEHVFRYVNDVESVYYKDINDQGNIEEYRYDIIVKEKTK